MCTRIIFREIDSGTCYPHVHKEPSDYHRFWLAVGPLITYVYVHSSAIAVVQCSHACAPIGIRFTMCISNIEFTYVCY